VNSFSQADFLIAAPIDTPLPPTAQQVNVCDILTVFQVNGSSGRESWRDLCLNIVLSSSVSSKLIRHRQLQPMNIFMINENPQLYRPDSDLEKTLYARTL
jgi:hypothetical protein